MKRLLLLSMTFLMALSMQAQRCAVLEFKAGVGISQNDVDGISAIFITYFRPAGYTMVERTQIDKVIEEQGFQRSRMTQAQMVRVGEILNVSKIVVGDINVVMGQYNVDTRVISVETGTIAATEGATFAASSYRTSMQGVAQKLAAKIAITPGATVQASAPAASTSRTRNKVEVLYEYLKIFPKEIGTFQSEPTSVIAQINKQAQYGYNNWRIPTNEELSLMRANNYLGGGEYMTRESKRGIVLLVTDGEDYETIEAEKKERENARIRAEQERKAELKAQGWVDLGLPSGTLWKDSNEKGGDYKDGNHYSREKMLKKSRNSLPKKEQFDELINKCQWSWTGNGYKVTGPNGNFIELPATGYVDGFGTFYYSGSVGHYWTSSPDNSGSDNIWILIINSGEVEMDLAYYGYASVRLVQNP